MWDVAGAAGEVDPRRGRRPGLVDERVRQLHRSRQVTGDERVEFVPGQREHGVAGLAGHRDGGRRVLRQRLFGFADAVLGAQLGANPVGRGEFGGERGVGTGELVSHPVPDVGVDVVAAEAFVTIGDEHAESDGALLQNGDVAGAGAVVENGEALAGAQRRAGGRVMPRCRMGLRDEGKRVFRDSGGKRRGLELMDRGRAPPVRVGHDDRCHRLVGEPRSLLEDVLEDLGGEVGRRQEPVPQHDRAIAEATLRGWLVPRRIEHCRTGRGFADKEAGLGQHDGRRHEVRSGAKPERADLAVRGVQRRGGVGRTEVDRQNHAGILHFFTPFVLLSRAASAT
ncbi:hypothetical protein SMNI109538_05565 [Smaragdicoccus niigatensis]